MRLIARKFRIEGKCYDLVDKNPALNPDLLDLATSEIWFPLEESVFSVSLAIIDRVKKDEKSTLSTLLRRKRGDLPDN